jgi:hypothetical protein
MNEAATKNPKKTALETVNVILYRTKRTKSLSKRNFKNLKPEHEQVQPNLFELAEAILEICKEEVGDAPRKPISNVWYFDTVVKNHASTLVKRGVGRSVSPAVCDCADPSHQFLRPHHTTITTNHNMQKKIPPRNKTPAAPTKHLPKTPWPHLPTRKEGLITRRTARRPGGRHHNVLKPHQVGN